MKKILFFVIIILLVIGSAIWVLGRPGALVGKWEGRVEDGRRVQLTLKEDGDYEVRAVWGDSFDGAQSWESGGYGSGLKTIYFYPPENAIEVKDGAPLLKKELALLNPSYSEKKGEGYVYTLTYSLRGSALVLKGDGEEMTLYRS